MPNSLFELMCCLAWYIIVVALAFQEQFYKFGSTSDEGTILLQSQPLGCCLHVKTVHHSTANMSLNPQNTRHLSSYILYVTG